MGCMIHSSNTNTTIDSAVHTTLCNAMLHRAMTYHSMPCCTDAPPMLSWIKPYCHDYMQLATSYHAQTINHFSLSMAVTWCKHDKIGILMPLNCSVLWNASLVHKMRWGTLQHVWLFMGSSAIHTHKHMCVHTQTHAGTAPAETIKLRPSAQRAGVEAAAGPPPMHQALVLEALRLMAVKLQAICRTKCMVLGQVGMHACMHACWPCPAPVPALWQCALVWCAAPIHPLQWHPLIACNAIYLARLLNCIGQSI